MTVELQYLSELAESRGKVIEDLQSALTDSHARIKGLEEAALMDSEESKKLKTILRVEQAKYTDAEEIYMRYTKTLDEKIGELVAENDRLTKRLATAKLNRKNADDMCDEAIDILDQRILDLITENDGLQEDLLSARKLSRMTPSDKIRTLIREFACNDDIQPRAIALLCDSLVQL